MSTFQGLLLFEWVSKPANLLYTREDRDPLFFGQLIARPPLHALLLYIFLHDSADPAAYRLRLVLL